MKKHLWLIPAAALLAFNANAQEIKKAEKPADTTKKVAPTTPPSPPKPTVADKIKSSKKINGLFTLYKDTVTGSLQLYVKKEQLLLFKRIGEDILPERNIYKHVHSLYKYKQVNRELGI